MGSRAWKADINPRARDILSGATTRGLSLAAEHVLGESNKKVPIEEATLERSGVTSVNAEDLTATISYDTLYAVRQHEAMNYRHDNGRAAKFLENAMNENVTEVREIIARELRGQL